MRSILRFLKAPVNYLLHDFVAGLTPDAGSPLASPRTCIPGPGTWTVTDAANAFSVSAGALVLNGATGTPAGLVSPGTYARKAGRGFLQRFPAHSTLNGSAWGWRTAVGAYVAAFYGTNTNLIGFRSAAGGSLDSVAWGAGAWQVAAVLRSTGAWLLAQQTPASAWTLLWVGSADSTAALYAVPLELTLAGPVAYSVTLADTRITDLGAPWTTDYGIATTRLAGARTGGDAFTAEANCLVEWTQTTKPSALVTDVRLRAQDATNYWSVQVDSTGALTLYEVVAGTPTQRATAAAGVANGHRIVVIADGSTIKGYSNNVLRWTYASATNFSGATAGSIAALGTGAAVSDCISWPRTLSGAALSSLQAV